MEPLPAPHEDPAKAVESEAPPGSLRRFRSLASRLFGVDQAEFREEMRKDEEERRKRREARRAAKS